MPTALVTGASRGLGVEFVKQLSEKGYRVFATVRRQADADKAKALGANVTVLVGELGEHAGIDALVKQLGDTPIDVLVNNAGVNGEDRAMGKLSWSEFERVYKTNIIAPIMLLQAVLPNLRKGSRKLVLNISSELGSITNAAAGFSYAYNSSKAALNMLTAKADRDLRSEGFTVVSFCPGWNKTDMGGKEAPLLPENSVRTLLATAEKLTIKDGGRYMRIDGKDIAY